MQPLGPYLDRKRRELSLLNGCRPAPFDPSDRQSVIAAIEEKFRVAASLKADQLLTHWSITETARPPAQWQRADPFGFNFGYQRADLEVRGPPIYKRLEALCSGCSKSTVYTGAGMSAIGALIMASLQLNDVVDILAPADCYVETRELLASFGSRIRTIPLLENRCGNLAKTPAARILWLDSSVRSSFYSSVRAITREIELVAFDTTCFWRDSSKIASTVQYALRLGIPIALVRSHTKLDSLGIEYGRLGSLVVITPLPASVAHRSRWTSDLIPRIRDAVRLFGAAPTLANFAPFEGNAGYRACSMARTTSIIRNTRLLARALRSRLPLAKLTTFQHGLYLIIAVRRDSAVEEVRRTAGEIAMHVASSGLPVRHAGSFGFDFVALDWCVDPIDRTNSIRRYEMSLTSRVAA